MAQTIAPTWAFDQSPIPDPQGRAERAVRFLKALRHPRAPKQPFRLDPWQQRVVERIYGPVDEHGQRLTRVVYLQVGRGNRKTSLSAALALLHTFGPERFARGQVLSAAADRKQARLAMEEATGIISVTPALANVARIQDFKNRIVYEKTGTTYEAISSDAATQYGRTPDFALIDELWAHKKNDLWHSIRTGLAKVPGSLCIIATTAGAGTNTPDYPIYEYAKRVAAGEIEDPSFLPIIFEAPKDCDWSDETIWHAVNPGLKHGYPDLNSLRQLAREAKNRPADRAAFQQFHLGIRQEHSVSPFVDMDVYDQGGEPLDIAEFEGKPCWIGVDMSVTTDLTAVVACFRDDDDSYAVFPFFFVPAANMQARADRDGVPYPAWADQGYITATPGDVVDYRAIEACIRDLAERFNVCEIGFDRAYAQPVMAPLQDDGFPVVIIQQGWVTQSPALNVLERAIIGRKFRHGGHPVLRWCFENVCIATDSAGNRLMHKGKSRDRIDGAVATWMALSRAAAGGGQGFIGSSDFDPALCVW